MSRTWTWASCCLALLVLCAPVPGSRAADPSENLLPAATKGFLSIANQEEWAAHWDKTQLGQLVQDPVLKPFADDLQRQFDERLNNLSRRMGMTWNDLDGVPGGELSSALVQVGDDQTALVVLVDVTGHHEQAEALLEKVSKNMAEQKAKRTESEVSGAPALLFELPKAEEGDESQRRAPPEGGSQAIYVLKDDLLAGSDNVDVLKDVLARLDGGAGDALADVPAFRRVMERCREDAGEVAPQVRWFLEPFGYVKATRAELPELNRPTGKSMLEQLEATGFTAIQGIGGFADFAVDGYELLHRTAVYAPKPWEGSMKMLVLPNTADSQPPSWAPRDLATCVSLSCDFLNAFDNFGPLFDEMVGEGEEGVWEDVLKSLEEDRDGPQINLREELFKHLDNRVIVVTNYELPITTTSERLLFAVATKDADAVAKAIEKTLKDDEEIRRREYEGHVIWETLPREKAEVEKVQLEIPPLGLAPEEEAEVQESEPLLPNAAVTVAQGYLLIASHYDFLVKALEPIEERETLSRSVDYLVVEDTIRRLAPEATSIFGFTRTDEEYRPTYELVRQGKMPESETILGRILNTLLGTGKPGAVRKQQVDGSKLPDFEFVRRHLGPAGLFTTTEEDGWFFKGFTLPKDAR